MRYRDLAPVTTSRYMNRHLADGNRFLYTRTQSYEHSDSCQGDSGRTPDLDEFRILTRTSLSKDTSTIQFSRKSDQQFSHESANRQTDRQTPGKKYLLARGENKTRRIDKNRTIVCSFVWTEHRNVTDGRMDRQTDEQCGHAVN